MIYNGKPSKMTEYIRNTLVFLFFLCLRWRIFVFANLLGEFEQ